MSDSEAGAKSHGDLIPIPSSNSRPLRSGGHRRLGFYHTSRSPLLPR